MEKISPLTACNILFIAVLAIDFTSCNKKFDEPPAYTPPNFTPTLTIAQFKAQHVIGSYEVLTNDDIIKGVVVANDSSGNFYKQIIIQDTSGGIAINIDDYNLYTSYPRGRQVFVKLKGLILYDNNRLIELGGSRDAAGNINPIAASLKENYVIKGTYGTPVAGKVVDISELNDSYQNMLIQLKNFEFSDADTSKLYADTSASKNSMNYVLRNCANKTITMRTSGFASFAGANVPNGNGNITAIYSLYGSAKQIFIRDTADVQFYGLRCNGGTGALTTVANIRSMYHGADIKLGAFKISGVIISDATSKNIATGSVVLQDGDAGIAVYFGGTVTYNMGDSIVLDVTGDSLQNYNGSLEIKTTPGTLKPTPVATGRTVIPRQLSISQISAGLSDIEYTLIKIENATATGGSTYSGARTLTDASGSITLFTSATATFANDNLPTDASAWIGYAKFFGSTKEFQIRNIADVNPGGGTGADGIELTTSPFTLNFDNLTAGLPAGVSVKISSSSTSMGTDGNFSGIQAAWSNTATGFKNFASATGLTETNDATTQNASTNRALGVKQTGTTGYDPGAAFVLEINNTSGRSNLELRFLLQSLDNSAGRITTWQVEYALGDNPDTFIPVVPSPVTLTTGPLFTNMLVTVNFGNALDNQAGKVWIRIVTLSGTTGSGSRPSTAIDDVRINWN